MTVIEKLKAIATEANNDEWCVLTPKTINHIKAFKPTTVIALLELLELYMKGTVPTDAALDADFWNKKRELMAKIEEGVK